jgi:hypothetical protein
MLMPRASGYGSLEVIDQALLEAIRHRSAKGALLLRHYNLESGSTAVGEVEHHDPGIVASGGWLVADIHLVTWVQVS